MIDSAAGEIRHSVTRQSAPVALEVAVGRWAGALAVVRRSCDCYTCSLQGMLKLSDNPPILHPAWPTVSDVTGPWWVAHTKARFEKAFAWDLLRREVAYFLPLIERVRVSSGKKRRVLMPIFPSYVFFAGDEAVRVAALQTGRLCQVIAASDQVQLADELAAIARALEGQAELDPYPHAVQGRRCRVTAGAFEGLEGIVAQRTAPGRLVLQVSMLGQAASMEIDADLLEPVD